MYSNNQLLKCNLWRIWLVIFVTLMNIYLIFVTITDYLELKKLSIGKLNLMPMNLQLSCLLVSLTLLPLIIITMVIITGNLANDGHVLGQDNDNNQFIFDSDSKGRLIRLDTSYHSKGFNSFKGHGGRNLRYLCKQQFLPISLFLQVISGVCYLISLPFVEGEKIRNFALKSSTVWHTDFDFILDPDGTHKDIRISPTEHYQQPVRPAFFSFIITLCLLSYRYPSVFWRTNHKFCMLFTCSLLLLTLHILSDYSSVCILIKLSYNSYFKSNHNIDFYNGLITVNPPILMICHLSSLFLFLLAHIAMFNYGLNQYFDNLAKHRQSLRIQFKKQQNLLKKSTTNNGEDGVVVEEDEEADRNSISESFELNDSDSMDESNKCNIECRKYNNLVYAILLGLIGSVAKVPILINCIRVLMATNDQMMRLNLITAFSFGIFWFLTWFGLALYDRWNFKVVLTKRRERYHKAYKCEVTNPNANIRTSSIDGFTTSTLPTNVPSTRLTMVNLGPVREDSVRGRHHVLHPNSPVYATCQPSIITDRAQSITPSRHANFSPRILRKSFDSYDGTELSSCYNYVFLHNGSNNAVAIPNTKHVVSGNVSGLNYASIVKQPPNSKQKFSNETPVSPISNTSSANHKFIPNCHGTEVPGVIMNSDDNYGSENSYGSNLSRSLTMQDKVSQNFLNDQPNEANSNMRHLINRYFAAENNRAIPNSSNFKSQRLDTQISVGRSPLLSYRFSNDSSPSSGSIINNNNNNNQTNIRHNIRENYELMEPDIISHGIKSNNNININNNSNSNNKNNNIISNTPNDTIDENEYDDAVGSSSSIIESKEISASIEVKLSNNNNNNRITLDDGTEDEENRLCSQV